jgi:hypothetical protein
MCIWYIGRVSVELVSSDSDILPTIIIERGMGRVEAGKGVVRDTEFKWIE